MKGIITFIQTLVTIFEQVRTSFLGLLDATISGGTIFATLAQLIVPGYVLWFVALMLALPVVIAIINILRDLF